MNVRGRCDPLPKETPLSEVLRQQLITSPLLDWKNKKSKNPREAKGLDDNLFEKRRRSKLREAKRTEVDISAAIQANLVRVKVKPEDHYVKKLEKDTEYFRKVDHRQGRAFPIKVDEAYQKAESESVDVPTIPINPGKQSVTSNDTSLKLITFNTWSKEHSIFGTNYTNNIKSYDTSRASHFRFGTMKHFNNQSTSPSSDHVRSQVVGVSSSAPVKNSTRLTRQHSELDLAPTAISLSLASFKTLGTREESFTGEISRKGSSFEKVTSYCAFPGFKLGQHCHSVAATILRKKHKEPKLSSSSSSDDLFQSTRYERDILEEKFRGMRLGKTNEENEDKLPAKYPKLKRKIKKVTKKQACKCKTRHSQCVKGDSSKKKVSKKRHHKTSFEDTGVSSKGAEKDPKIEATVSFKQSAALTGATSSQSYEILHPCNKETCPKKIKEASNPDAKVKTVSELKVTTSDKTLSRLKSNVIEAPSGLPKLEIADVDPCTSEICLFSKSNALRHKKSQKKSASHRSHSSRRDGKPIKVICSYKTCKAPHGYPRSRFKRLRTTSNRSVKWRSGKSNDFSRKQKEKKKRICNCEQLKINGDATSESDDIWVDADVRRARNRRYKMNLEFVSRKNKEKCGGYAMGDGRCRCYACKAKDKPWIKYLKQDNALIDIPYLLSPKTLKERELATSEIKETLGQTFQWSEENLKNFCTKHYSCKKPNTRKELLKNNPYRWNLCDQKPKSTIPKPTETVPEEQGMFGYYVDVVDDRLAMDETFGKLQTLAERAVYCKWHQDIADMKVNHFKENMPTQQSCYDKPTHFDQDRRTCYNPKLIERLADMVQYNMKPDRKIHEFSFPPKLLKYQEPQLVGDTRTDMPEIKTLKDPSHFPTIYRDIFKTDKHNKRQLMDTLLPPLQWTDHIGFWEMKVSLEPDTVETNRTLINYMNENETLCHAINKNFCAGRYRLYMEVFAEVIRQELLDYPERAVLLSRIREEFLLTILLYDGGLEMTLTSTTHLWKSVEAELMLENTREMQSLSKDIRQLKSEISELTSVTYKMDKRTEELTDSRGYLHEDDVRLYKKTNQQLSAQLEAIRAGFLYELD